ncbi:hypothetical protein [Isoptericola croceus]|uniref:hypothetical protein n=1 Tax=Isoptericola croceus TaxID=3031406 RepID=UPI0023F7D7BE|nr:hypothetical protein [Isoptericola croceus]
MNTFTESAHPRAGDGKFEAKAVDEAPGGTEALDVSLARDEQAAVDTGRARLSAMAASASDGRADERQVAVHTITTATLIRYPDAARIETGECDQLGCYRQHIQAVHGADGAMLSDADELMDLSDELVVAEAALGDGIPGTVEQGVVWRQDRDGSLTASFDVAAVRQAGLPAHPAVDRAAATIDGYRARFDDLDVGEDTAARDMLTDLHHWARARGIDLEAAFRAAGQVADEETTTGTAG